MKGYWGWEGQNVLDVKKMEMFIRKQQQKLF